MISKFHPSKKEIREFVKDYVRSRIFEMAGEKKLKQELYKVWGFSKSQQIELRLEAWINKMVSLLKK